MVIEIGCQQAESGGSCEGASPEHINARPPFLPQLPIAKWMSGPVDEDVSTCRAYQRRDPAWQALACS